MAIKKTQMYSSLFAACDELRGGLDASQYKNYILPLLFMKYVTDKFKGRPYPQIKIPDGCGFDDLRTLCHTPDIGERMDIILQRVSEENQMLNGIFQDVRYNDDEKIGHGQEKVDKLSKLIQIFSREEFDLHANGALGDDILGDAYEYLMRQFATESGKSKGQFYTPAEASRVLAALVGLDGIRARPEGWTLYDPACGSGSLLIRGAASAPCRVSIYGQEKDVSTAGLAKMNCVIHGIPTAEIRTGNTFSNPQFFQNADREELKRFDFIVINPPFSYKSWQNGYRDYGRQEGWGAQPPAKNGDYAWLLHVIKSMKSTGRAAVIMPLGVLSRPNAEGVLRKAIVDRGLIEGIVAFPPNIFYGTPIPACVLILSKGDARKRRGIFMIDASRGFTKDGDKNRLRERDVRKIIDTYKGRIEENHYSRHVPLGEIVANGYNLNIPRYIDSGICEDVHSIEAHLKGGIPKNDIDALAPYWDAFPSLRRKLFAPLRKGFLSLRRTPGDIYATIAGDPDFAAHGRKVHSAFIAWRRVVKDSLYAIKKGINPKAFIGPRGTAMLKAFKRVPLLDSYDAYEVLLSYWNESMADDLYILAQDGFGAARKTEDIYKEKKKKDGSVAMKVVGWDGRLIPRVILDRVYFANEVAAIETARAEAAAAKAEFEEFVDEEMEEDGALADYAVKGKDEDSVKLDTKKLVADFKTLKKEKDQDDMFMKLAEYFRLEKAKKDADKAVKVLEAILEEAEKAKYPELTLAEAKHLIIEEKWLFSVWSNLAEDCHRISAHLAERVIQLASRYGQTLGELDRTLRKCEVAVAAHLREMGY